MSQITTLGGGPTVIHLTYRVNNHGTLWAIACMPSVVDFTTSAHQPNYLRSNDTRAVTCDQCKATQVFKDVQKTERP